MDAPARPRPFVRSRRSTVVLALAVAALAVACVAPTPPVPDVDVTFGTDGFVAAGPGDFGFSFAARSGGGLVVAVSGGTDLGLVAYDEDGHLDTTFGTGGRASIDLGKPAQARAVAVQSDGRIVVGGAIDRTTCGLGGCNNDHGIALARFTASGDPDPTFGVGGSTSAFSYVGFNAVSNVAVQPGLGILALLYGGQLVRFRDDGAVDARVVDQFGTVVHPGFGPASDGFAETIGGPGSAGGGLEVLADGSILATRSSATSSLAHLTADGSLESSFGTGGVTEVPFAALSIDTAPDGSVVVVGGTTDYTPTSSFRIARYTATGAPDPTFGSAGVAAPFVATNSLGGAVRVLAGGRILVSGSASDAPGQFEPFSLALTSGGTPDAAYGGDGIKRAPSAEPVDGYGMVVQANGRAVVIGLGTGYQLVRFTDG